MQAAITAASAARERPAVLAVLLVAPELLAVAPKACAQLAAALYPALPPWGVVQALACGGGRDGGSSGDGAQVSAQVV